MDSFLLTGLISALAGTLLVVRRPEKPHFFMKEGCVSVALSWIVLSLIGALPFMISGTIPHFVDALSRRSQVLQQREPALWHLWKMHHVVS